MLGFKLHKDKRDKASRLSKLFLRKNTAFIAATIGRMLASKKPIYIFTMAKPNKTTLGSQRLLQLAVNENNVGELPWRLAGKRNECGH